MIYLIVISVLMAVLSGLCKAIIDLSEENKMKFYKKTFWIKSLSWQNKWKNGDKKQGEKFFGSSRWFVSLTDAWHLFGLLFRLCYSVAFACVGYLISINIWYAFGFIVAYTVFASSFHIFYTSKILRK